MRSQKNQNRKKEIGFGIFYDNEIILTLTQSDLEGTNK